MKLCTKCNIVKELSSFAKNAGRPDGYNGWCKECIRQWALQNSEQRQMYYAAYRIENREAVKANKHQYYETHKDAIKHKTRMWEINNRDKSRAGKKAWKARNPLSVITNTNRRRARIKDLRHSFTVDDWLRVVERFDNRCAYCGASDVALEQEHFIPVVMGGHYEFGNIVPSCGECNRRKSGKHPSDFLSEDIYAYILDKLQADTDRLVDEMF